VKHGGRVMVADVAIESSKSAAYDHLEILRDPSHTHALTKDEFASLFLSSELSQCRQSAYGVDIELESQLKASFPKPGDEEVIRRMVTGDVGIDSIGISARKAEDKIVYTVPIAVYVGQKA
jgi:hypothetical protein